MEPRSENQRIVRLLTALVVLMAVLLLGMSAAGLFAWSRYRSAQKAIGQATSGSAAARPGPEELLAELNVRREVLSRELQAQADATQQQLRALQARRDQEANVEKGPIDKAEQLFRLAQLMSDQSLVMMKNLTGTQEAIAKSLSNEPSKAAPPQTTGRKPKYEHRKK